MKGYLVFVLSLLFSLSLSAQTKKQFLFETVNQKSKSGVRFSKESFFKRIAPPFNKQDQVDTLIKGSVKMILDKNESLRLFKNNPDAILFELPFSDTKNIQLRLIKESINTTGDFAFGEITNSNERIKTSSEKGLHYRGYFSNDSTSIAALSIFPNGDVMGVFSNKEGNFILGKIKNSGQYIIYNSKDFVIPKSADCATRDTADHDYIKDPLQRPSGTLGVPPTLCKKIIFYWEVDYDFFFNYGSDLTNVQNYVTGLFNVVATIYQNEGIVIELAESYVWTKYDPYRNTSSIDALLDFKERWVNMGNSYKGDLAHLISGYAPPVGTNYNGGYAILNALCERVNSYGYSNVYGYYNNFPTYSWDVNCIAHEIGHNLGSLHTQWCGWRTGANNTCGAIDNCYTIETDFTCLYCESTVDIYNKPPGWSGTIMSYCHNYSGIGINLSNGFGFLPQTLIRSKVANASCLTDNVVWTGAQDSLWSNTSNWSCGNEPNSSTDVTIVTGVPRFPVVKTSDAFCRSLRDMPGASVKINTGRTLTITGQKNTDVVAPSNSGKLFITGNATQAGWMNGGDPPLFSQQFRKITNSLYEIPSILLTAGQSYLLVPNYGDWSQKFGFAGTALTNNVNGDNFVANGSDIKAPATTGNYHILVDFQRGKFSLYPANNKIAVVPPASDTLYITGNATPGGWMGVGDPALVTQRFQKISSTIYQIDNIFLSASNSYLFVPKYGDYSKKYGALGGNNNNITNGDYLRFEGSDLLSPPVSGNYKIKIDFKIGIFELIKL